jgi:large subunit ribosomal protein L3
MLGKKIGMTSIFSYDGDLIPVTIIEAGPCKVLSIKTEEKDGYNALQLGFGERKEKNINKPELGYFKKNDVAPTAFIKEFGGFETGELNIGDEIKADFFSEGDIIKVKGKSKGKGFQGVMKRHGFRGVGGTTHGQSDRLRAPGSIGQSSSPSKVFKGQKMAGRTGHETVTVPNIEVVKVNSEENLILLKGPVPGSVNSILELIKN